MSLLRAYLFGGLVAHKLLWEWLKRPRGPAAASVGPRDVPVRIRLVKLVKILILGAIVVQTLVPVYWFPIVDAPGAIIVVGTAIYTLGLAVAIVGRVQLGRNWSDIEAARVLAHQAVVQRGVYRYIRHPIYVGDLLLLTGLELALNSWLVLGVLALTPIVLSRAVREEELLKQSLSGYREYCRTSKRFIPFVV